MHSSRFSRPVLEQPRSHPALGEPTPQPRLRLPRQREQDDSLAFDREIDGRSRVQPDPIPEVLRDDDLAFGTNPVRHTAQE